MRSLFAVLLFCLLNTNHYTLNKDRARSSAIIKAGTIDVTVSDIMEHPEDGSEVYKATFDIDITMMFYGQQTAQEDIYIPAEIYTEEFMEELKGVESISYPDYDLKHLATIDNCEEILFFNIRTTQVDSIAIEDAQIKTRICDDIPGLGSEFIDVSGVASGFAAKAGFDLTEGR